MAANETTRRILDLARSDRSGASAAIAELGAIEQVDLVCATPLSRRAEIIGLLPEPEKVIPLLPEAELCFTVKSIGIFDSTWLLDHATPEQVVAAVDLDIWRGATADRAALDAWLDALSACEDEAFARSVRALDPEVVVLYLKHRIHCVQKPDDDDGWQPPAGGQTVEGQFYFTALSENDDLAPVAKMLSTLFVSDYWTYFRMMHGVIHELDSDNEEWALRWRTGRLEDLGFPTWERAMRIYAFIKPDKRAEISDDVDPLDIAEWQLPVYVRDLPAARDHQNLLFRALAALDPQRRRAALFAFIALANKVAVADRMELSDPDTTPRAIDKAARFASLGLAHIAEANDRAPEDVVQHVTLERLFGVGANLEPEDATPKPRPPGH